METNESSSLLLSIKKKIRDWCLKTTSHGIPHIFMTRNWIIRVMWLLFFLVSVGYCVYIIIVTTIKYSKFGTKISVEIVDELPATFPAITICNINAFNENKASEYLMGTDIAEDLLAYQCLNISDTLEFLKCLNSTDTNDEILDVLVDDLKRKIANDRSIDNNRKHYGYDLDSEMLVSCLYNDKPCGSVNFSTYWSNDYGNCYTFNDGKTGEIVKISDTGIKYGLKMEIVVDPPDKETKFSYKKGLHLIVHNKTDLPFTLSSGVSIPTGFETYIGVSRTRRSVLEDPYSDCLKELKPFSPYSERLFKYFIDLNLTYYDQTFCYSLCYQDQLLEQCSCIDTVTPRISNADFCAGDDAFCMFDFKEQFFKSNINYQCEGACRQQCERIEYNLATSMATYPTLSYLKFLKSNQYTKSYFPSKNDDEYLERFGRNSFLKLIVNYDRLYYTIIKDLPDQKFEDYLASLGGQLGLFIGISFLSLLELVELIIELIILGLRYNNS